MSTRESFAGTLQRYLARLPLAPGCRAAVEAHALDAGDTIGEALADVHAQLAGTAAAPGNPAHATIGARIRLAHGDPSTRAGPRVTRDVQGRERLDTTPPLARSSMAPRAWPAHRARGTLPEDACPPETATTQPGSTVHWHRRASRRRLLLLALIIGQTIVATDYMTRVLPYHGRQPLEIAVLVLFAILFGWISAGFWTAIAGFVLLASGRDRFAISKRTCCDSAMLIPEDARTAIVMPICNEDVARVFAGLRATFESLRATGALERFDFFVLSDSGNPDIRVAEIDAWATLNRTVGGFGRIFYRWRQHRIKRKSGNIADFCRRWGRKYRYMVVLDADSVMSGDCLTTLVRIAEANPDAGIIQTAPRAAGRDTFYARVQQFATAVYGPLFTAGLHFWQFGESHYWGHNAIIRVAPFIRHCALGRLPGRGALSGEILSHDFVEAALMRRAGWGVWIAYDLPGSYEEMPPNLIDELSRDRRWCQGNLMNFRLFWMEGLHPAHRAVFMTGVLAYLSAPLWFAFLILSTVLLAVHTLLEPQYFVRPYQLFPVWPEWRPEWAVALFSATAVLLFLPKLLAAARVALREASTHGGRLHLAASLLGEITISAVLAPIRMLFHTRFVVTALAGRSVRWKSPPREDAETGWMEALRRHGLHTAIGVVWAWFVWWLNPSFLWWLLPVVGALILSVPISVITSRAGLGRKLRRRHYFLIPEESHPPPEIKATRRYWRRAAPAADFTAAVVDPIVNALVCAQAVMRPAIFPCTRAAAATRVERALHAGPEALSPTDRTALIADPVALSELHWAVWTSSARHDRWREACENPLVRNASAAPPGVTPIAEPAPRESAIAASNPAGG